jgi:hypothetical protein
MSLKMRFLVKYKHPEGMVISTRKGTENHDIMKTFIQTDSKEQASEKCRKHYGEPVLIQKY